MVLFYVLFIALYVLMVVAVVYSIYSTIKCSREYSDILKDYHKYINSFDVEGSFNVRKDKKDELPF